MILEVWDPLGDGRDQEETIGPPQQKKYNGRATGEQDEVHHPAATRGSKGRPTGTKKTPPPGDPRRRPRAARPSANGKNDGPMGRIPPARGITRSQPTWGRPEALATLEAGLFFHRPSRKGPRKKAVRRAAAQKKSASSDALNEYNPAPSGQSAGLRSGRVGRRRGGFRRRSAPQAGAPRF